METDFSIDMAVERIIDARTRELFREVHSSYSHGNYRSAVVMLWSVVICDLLFKLSELRDLYSDATADSILKEIEATRSKNPKSPDWEMKLVEEVKKRTELLEEADIVNLTTLQNHRHLSAHPVLTATDILFAPNRETTRAHLRNMLEGLLTKPSIMTKRVFNALVEDLEVRRDVLLEPETLIRYLNARYFPHSSPALEDQLFRSLWPVVFRATDARCDANRDINYQALLALYGRRTEALRELIGKNRDLFSNVTFTGGQLTTFLDFLSRKPEIYPLLTDAARAPIERYLEENLAAYAVAWYLSRSVQEHIETVLSKVIGQREIIPISVCQSLVKISEENISGEKADEVAALLYVNSPAFDTADQRFEKLLQPRIDHYAEPQLKILLRGIEDNGQTSGRRRAERDHKQVKAQIDRVLGEKFDPKEFPTFSESIKLPRSAWYVPSVFDDIEE